MAKEKGVAVNDIVVIMLDRPRHEDAMAEIREVGARIRLIPHGDVSAALAAVTEGSAVDLLYGIGGTPEGVLSAAAIKCTGGSTLGRVGLGVHEADAQHRARAGQHVVGERRAVVGVEDLGQPSPHDGGAQHVLASPGVSAVMNRPCTNSRLWSSTIKNSFALVDTSTRGCGTHGPTSTSVIHRSFGRSAS